ncbi:VTT domain-containing protein [Azospirillum halopraeferens]|uniref:VTT domain-containing protein n=1 Tax=Azospirillum halopraeferens TaxID=34010 RepID=UPI0003FD7714|nr:VTT domain-containing protein [Azospirillum halopraeferens]
MFAPSARTASDPSADRPLLVPGETCWRLERADRVAVLVDAEEYFAAAKEAMRRARRSILLAAWDVDTRVRLTPQDRRHGRPDRLGTFLNWLAATRPGLEIRVLKWGYAELFAVTRWQKPLAIKSWFTHPRLRYRIDTDHPTGGCHHQKVLVIDDRVAFCGGIDITANRWDTRAHRADEPLRRQPDGTPYEPFHDTMMAVDGDAARALGDLLRERWRRATGEEVAPPVLPPPPRGSGRRDPWPMRLQPLLRDRTVAIARTDPAWNGRPQVVEVETLFRTAIAAARRSIYIESQYFAADAVAEALKARLAEPDGPEVVVVNPIRTPNGMENAVMSAARCRLFEALRAADRHGRFRLYAAVTDGDRCITVHSKLMVVDDRLLRIGSANLANRSMGLDTECDLALEAGADDAEGRAAIARTRNDLIAEHLGTTPERVERVLAATGSLVATVEALDRGEGRRMVPLESLPDTDPGPIAGLVAESRLLDPDRPRAATELIGRALPSTIPRRWGQWAVLLVALLALGGLAALWRWSDLSAWASLDTVLDTLQALGESALAPLLLVGVYVAAGFVLFPLTVLVAATAIALGPLTGFLTAMAGALASAAAAFWVGRRLGRRPLERLGGRRLMRASRSLADSGILAVATIRVVPVAPYTVINLAAGASRVRFPDFVIGTAIGLAPGTLAFSLLGEQLRRTLYDPTAADVALLAGAGVLAVAAGWLAGRVLSGIRARGKTKGAKRP